MLFFWSPTCWDCYNLAKVGWYLDSGPLVCILWYFSSSPLLLPNSRICMYKIHYFCRPKACFKKPIMVVVAQLEARMNTQSCRSNIFFEKRDPLRLLFDRPCSDWRWSEIGKERAGMTKRKKKHVIHDWCFHSLRYSRLKCSSDYETTKQQSQYLTGERHVSWAADLCICQEQLHHWLLL